MVDVVYDAGDIDFAERRRYCDIDGMRQDAETCFANSEYLVVAGGDLGCGLGRVGDISDSAFVFPRNDLDVGVERDVAIGTLDCNGSSGGSHVCSLVMCDVKSEFLDMLLCVPVGRTRMCSSVFGDVCNDRHGDECDHI